MRDPWGRRLDVLDIVSLIFGLGFLALAVVCVIATVSAVSSFGDPAEAYTPKEEFLSGVRGIGIVFFPVAGLVTFFTGWMLAGDILRRWWRNLRRREE
jgi:hypothetical protein